MNLSSKMLVDTDTLSLYFKKYSEIVREAQKYLRLNRVFTFSVITRFEILRGMKVKNAAKQIQAFDLFCEQNEVIELNDEIVVRAADIYADLYKRGQIIGDADILIAVTAIENELAIVTNNESHFERIANLKVINWNK